jgi:TorA maturation chaperone TorD
MRDANMDRARSLYYAMFSRLFTLSGEMSKYYELRSLVETLKSNPLDKLSAEAFESLYVQLPASSNVALIKEFDILFYAPQTKTIRTTASYYDSGVENGRKRLEMQNFLAKTKIRRDEEKFSDYEDHIGFIFTVLAELTALTAEGEEVYANTAHCIFNEILNEFVDEFAKTVYEHPESDIFKNVAVILKAFIEFERIYLDVSVPAVKPLREQAEKVEEISEEERARRERNRALRAQGPKKEEACDLFVASGAEEEI